MVSSVLSSLSRPDAFGGSRFKNSVALLHDVKQDHSVLNCVN